MHDIKFTHSVICVTYNHSKYIGKCLTSILSDDVIPDEIIVCDDCSSDDTVEQVEAYIKKYPGVIKLYKNKVNQGLFQNFNIAMKLATSDLIHFVSGDDWLEPGMIRSMNNVMLENKIDPIKEAFVLAPDIYIYNLDQKLKLVRNDFVNGFNPLKSLLRDKYSTRLVGFSRKLYSNIKPYRTDIGLWADRLHELELLRYVSSIYKVPGAFPVYRAGVGTTSTVKADELSSSYLKMLDCLTANDLGWDKNDICYIEYLKARELSKLNGQLVFLLKFYFKFSTVICDGVNFVDLRVVTSSFFRKKLKRHFN
tara:strand:+ start:119 stop:1045 length:927 start_codon:yes stop_codon:yes gene_type:complete